MRDRLVCAWDSIARLVFDVGGINLNKLHRDVPMGQSEGAHITQFPEDQFAALASRQRRLKCFMAGSYRRPLPSIDGIEYVFDADDQFDLIVAPATLDVSTFERFISQCSNPLGPLIAFSDVFGARADIVVNEPTTAALALAVSTLEPLAARIAGLPRQPVGFDRDGLVALGLAYTRDRSIEARWQPKSADMIEYPLLLGIHNARALLERLADAGLLRRRFFERLYVCQHCGSSQLHAREVCLSCHSSYLGEHSLVHHYSCGFQATQSAFEHPDGYVCPKCHRQLRHYGVDYDKPGVVTACQACGETMAEPDVGLICAGCGGYTSSENAAQRDWYHYDLVADGLAAVRIGQLPHADLTNPRSEYSLRDFRLILAKLLSVARRYERPLTALRLTLDPDLLRNLGRKNALDVCQFVREVVVQCIRESDMVASLPTGIVVCFNETSSACVNAALGRIRQRIAGVVRVGFNFEIEVFEGEHVGKLLEDLS
jgi:hypothetical protein